MEACRLTAAPLVLPEEDATGDDGRYDDDGADLWSEAGEPTVALPPMWWRSFFVCPANRTENHETSSQV